MSSIHRAWVREELYVRILVDARPFILEYMAGNGESKRPTVRLKPDTTYVHSEEDDVPHKNDRRWQLSGPPLDGREPVASRLARRRDGGVENPGTGRPRPGDRRRADAVRPRSSGNQRHGRLLRLADGRHPADSLA